MEIKSCLQKGALRCANSKGGWIRVGITWKSNGGCNKGYYDVQMKGQMDKRGYYDVEIRVDAKRGQYDVQITRADG